MKKSVLVGILVLVLVIGGGLVWRLVLSPQGAGAAGLAGSGGPGGGLSYAEVEPLTITGRGGYSLDTVDLGEGKVPLLRIPLDSWGGYAALFAANGGPKASRDSAFYRLGHFAVELVPVEGAQAQLEGYATGKYPIIWASMDSLPLLYDALRQDKRVIPQVLGLFDWSIGGDGILLREGIKGGLDLKGKTILTSSSTPYSFFLLWYLAQIGLSPADVRVVHVDDGPKALEAFRKNPGLAAWVTWNPFLKDALDPASEGYVKGSRLLISSRDANQLVADVYVVRRDLLQDKPEMMAAFVQAMMEGAALLARDPGPAFAGMAAFYKLPGGAAEAREMLADVHIANFPENTMFFDAANPIGAQKIFLLSQEYSKALGSLGPESSYEPERSLALGPLESLARRKLFGDQKNEISTSFNRKAAFDIADLENQRIVMKNDLRLYFEAQRLDFDVKADSEEVRQNLRLLQKVAEQMGFMGTTVVKLVGHLDTSKQAEFKARGQQAYVEASAQAKLISKRRAEFVKKLLVERYRIDPERIVTEGRGWDTPISADDPEKNRRVEVQFLSFE